MKKVILSFCLLFLIKACICQDTISRQQTCQRLNNVFQTICQDTKVADRHQGVPGKRGPPGSKGEIGKPGPKGADGIVDHDVVESLISQKYNDVLRVFGDKLEDLEESVQSLSETVATLGNRIQVGKHKVSPTADCANRWKTEPVDYIYIGCYKEQTPWDGVRVIPPVEGKFPTVTGSYSTRTNAIEKCAKIAACMGYKVFVQQAGGWCATSADAHKVYGKYGSSNDCAQDGEGASHTNAVYMLI